jgi:hypothetical protein
MSYLNVFRPVEGAVLDLESLQAVSDSTERILESILTVSFPGASSVVLEGLEMRGELSTQGPPGTVRPDSKSENVVITPGTAILTGRNGRRYLFRVDEEMSAPWPTSAGPGVSGALVLMPKVETSSVGGNVRAARERVTAVLGFVKPEQADATFLLKLAESIGNGRDWATDHARVWQPDHAAIRTIIKRFESLERTVWRAEPEGSVWDRQVLGRNWVWYQTVGASALQAAKMSLQSRATSTLDRVRILNALFESLHSSVERAATDLLTAVGAGDGGGPYRKVGERILRGGG